MAKKKISVTLEPETYLALRQHILRNRLHSKSQAVDDAISRISSILQSGRNP
ncbi:hypothetical protein HYV84_07735 [Candidatus Woesearchaeota archaeon]|nr:hypothetical protein [Candidatus Woesearchaeota archaeon]